MQAVRAQCMTYLTHLVKYACSMHDVPFAKCRVCVPNARRTFPHMQAYAQFQPILIRTRNSTATPHYGTSQGYRAQYNLGGIFKAVLDYEGGFRDTQQNTVDTTLKYAIWKEEELGGKSWNGARL